MIGTPAFRATTGIAALTPAVLLGLALTSVSVEVQWGAGCSRTTSASAHAVKKEK